METRWFHGEEFSPNQTASFTEGRRVFYSVHHYILTSRSWLDTLDVQLKKCIEEMN